MAKKPLERDPSELAVGGTQQNELFEVLAHPRRRFLLQYLQTTDTPLSVTELTTGLESWEGHGDADDGEHSIEVALVHSHLPVMAEAGLITYDTTERTVALADRTDEVQGHLQIQSSD